MSITNKQYFYRYEREERRQSRLKQTRAYILNHNLSGMLNNYKWRELLEWTKQTNTAFTFTTFLSPEAETCTCILELEGNSMLADTSGNFIEFFEISSFRFPKTDIGLAALKELNVEYIENETTLEVVCYR